jgi:hypothetical protein
MANEPPSVRELWLESLEQLDVNGAVIFADDQAATGMACAIGLPALLELGVTNVLRLGDASAVGPGCHVLSSAPAPARAIVLCSSFLPEAYAALRTSLAPAASAHFSQCTIACTFSERAHATFVADGAHDLASGGAYEACRAEVSQWLAPGCDVRVVQLALPAQVCPVGGSLFLLDIEGVRPLIESDMPELRRAAAARDDGGQPPSRVEDVLWSSLPPDRQRALGCCAMSFAGFLRAAAIRPTLFALGATSLLVTRELNQHLPAGGTDRRSTDSIDASVLLVDRTLDVVAPSLATDHPLDGLLATASGRVAAGAPAGPSGETEKTAAADATARGPGDTFASPAPPLSSSGPQTIRSADAACVSLLDNLLTRRAKEVSQQLLKTLALVVDEYDDDDDDDDDGGGGGGGGGESGGRGRGALGVLPPARPTSEKLRAMIDQLRAVERVGWEKQGELDSVQLTLGEIDALASSVSRAELMSHQKLLQHTASESLPAAFTELITLAGRAHNKAASAASASASAGTRSGGRRGGAAPLAPLGTRDLLPLVAMVYSLGGPRLCSGSMRDAVDEHEQRLREALLQAFLRDPSAGDLLAGDAPRLSVDELSASAIMARRQHLTEVLDVVFERLRALAAARRGLGTSEPLLLSGAQTAGEVYRPLLRHVLERALRNEDIAEMHRPNSWGASSLFSRGANLLGVKTRARLTDHRTIIVFVLGGISLAEVRELRQLIAQHPKHRLLVGSTGVISPDAVWELLTDGLYNVR